MLAEPPKDEGSPLADSREHETAETATSLGFVALAIGSLFVIIAAGVFVWSGATTASARIAASTSNESSLLTAASIDLVIDGGSDVASTGLLIDAGGLYPGLRLERCFEVTYFGNATDVPVRLFGRPGEGTGLEAFIDATIDVGTGSDNECVDFSRNDTLFDDTLVELWNQHGSFVAGLPLIRLANDGESTFVRVTVEVVDDNEAQDLTTAFWLTVEARP